MKQRNEFLQGGVEGPRIYFRDDCCPSQRGDAGFAANGWARRSIPGAETSVVH